jgi:hypothetical protein
MGESELPDFIPVPLRNRRGGWTAERQRAFIASLARGLKPGRAAALLGLSRQSAYLLRNHPQGASFAGAWDRACAAAGAAKRQDAPPSEWERAVKGVLHPVRYRGRIVAWDRRFDATAFLRLLRRLDKSSKSVEPKERIISPKVPNLCQERARDARRRSTRKSAGS